MELEENITYSFNLKESTTQDYKCCVQIIEWLKRNMESLTDDNNKTLFSKVNYGYNEETLKGFGKKPVCDVYIDNFDYRSDLTENVPDKVHTFIICYLKGNMNATYFKACELTDYLLQEFNTNDSFRELTIHETVGGEILVHKVVRETRVSDVTLEIIPQGKTYGVLCAFSLEHELY